MFFSLPLKFLVNQIIKIYPFQILIRYLIVDAVVRGARASKKIDHS